MPAPMRPEDYDAILDAAEDVKAARNTREHDAAIKRAADAVKTSNRHHREDNARIQREKHVERGRVSRRGK